MRGKCVVGKKGHPINHSSQCFPKEENCLKGWGRRFFLRFFQKEKGVPLDGRASDAAS